jgi:hypothetical protein
MAIHREESQSDYGRTEGERQNVQSMDGVLGTYSEIRDVLVGDNPAGRE